MLQRLDIKIIIQHIVPNYTAEEVKVRSTTTMSHCTLLHFISLVAYGLVQVAVARLSEEGHIYSTVDDDHYMVT